TLKLTCFTGVWYCPTHEAIDPENALSCSGYTICTAESGVAVIPSCATGLRPIFDTKAFSLNSIGSVESTFSSAPSLRDTIRNNGRFASSPTANTYVCGRAVSGNCFHCSPYHFATCPEWMVPLVAPPSVSSKR